MKIINQKSMKLLVIVALICCSRYLVANNNLANHHVLQIKWLADDSSMVNENLTGDTVFSVVEKMPEFPGGTDSLKRFIVSNVQVPKEALTSGVNGKVYVKFIISKQGKVLTPKIFKGIGKGCDEEAVRVIQKLPDWIPGYKDGKPVNVSYMVPISFNVISDESEVVKEEMPEFPGGHAGLMRYLSINLRYPPVAKELGITGRVILQFVIDSEGKISNVKVLRALGGGCDEEAIRLVKAMPNWKPGKQNDKEVSVYFTLPIVFQFN